MGALRAPLTGSPAFVFAFVFVSISILNNLNYQTKRLKTVSRTPATNKKQRTKKNCKKTKHVSKDRSRREDSNGPRIVKIGDTLGYFWRQFWPFQSLRKKSKVPREQTLKKSHYINTMKISTTFLFNTHRFCVQ